jgi:hypothetical protein
MRTDRSSVAAFVLLGALGAIVVAPGCDAFGGDSDDKAVDQPAPAADGGGAPDADGPKAPPVGGPATSSELTNALGIFVANTGSDSADGTSERPLARIQPAIDLAKKVGKRVYVCAGTYLEALVVADSISIVGGLDCSAPTWKTSTSFSRVEAPESPAIRASNIASPTRLEGLDITAPGATAPSGSSIGLIADKASALVVARSKITAGNAMKGDNGVEGIQLANAATTTGAAIPGAVDCATPSPGLPYCSSFGTPPSGGQGGTNTCVGAPGFVTQAGGTGGTGGLYDVKSVNVMGQTSQLFVAVPNAEAKAAPPGRTGADGVDSPDGLAAASTGAFSAAGYTPADGNNGTNGTGGSGGSGGDGLYPGAAPFISAAPLNARFRGWGGGGGGAGGCPGLAGTAGKGGGASVAAVLIDSATTFDGVQLVAGNGGDAGHGSLGSAPLAGGARNNPEIPGQNPTLAPCLGDPGGRGGFAGVSTNGGSGPSAGIAHVGAAPKIIGDTKMTPGQGGAGVDVQSRTELGITKTVPATEAGVAKEILAL